MLALAPRVLAGSNRLPLPRRWDRDSLLVGGEEEEGEGDVEEWRVGWGRLGVVPGVVGGGVERLRLLRAGMVRVWVGRVRVLLVKVRVWARAREGEERRRLVEGGRRGLMVVGGSGGRG